MAAVPAATGLSEAEAARRLAARGKQPPERSSRSYRSIVLANAINIPNGILFVFGVLTIAFASWKDALFIGILVANIAIGSFQEIRSKRAVDQVVVGDVVRLTGGDQVVADGSLLDADGLAVDESNLTGESEPVVRAAGDEVWSGSFVVEGAGVFEATAVGPDSRAARVTQTARTFRHE